MLQNIGGVQVHLPPLIEDLAIILMAAAFITILFRAIKQPVVLGYIIAGFVVGPHFLWAPTVVDSESVKVWAEIGVIFLLFALGLEFSFKKLASVGAPASITAVVEVVGMVLIGYAVGQLFSWSNIDSLFLGGILAISSTTIIIRAFEELGMKSRGFASLVFGVLIVEDLVAILLMVLLSTVAVSQQFSGTEMFSAAMKLVFFLTLWFVAGIFLIPTFLKRAKPHLQQETLLIVSVGLCFLMVVLASHAGFSPALGAFIMGSILAETVEGHRIEHLIQPVKDLFAAVFFVSVGMLIDPQILTQYAVPIMVITVVTIFGKLVTSSLGALLSGRSLKHSVQAGMSLAQIGEFSFIIAGLGQSLKVTSDFLYPIAISVSAITTFTTPYLIRSSDGLVGVLQNKLPAKWLAAHETFRTASVAVGRTSEWRTFARALMLKMFANGVVIAALFLIVANYLSPFLVTELSNSFYAHTLSLCAAFILSGPFLWAFAVGKPSGPYAVSLWKERRITSPLIVLEVARWLLAIILCGTLAAQIASTRAVVVTVGIVLLLLTVALSRYFGPIYLWVERRFVSNLNERSDTVSKVPNLAPWDAHLVELHLSHGSPLIGKSLASLSVREKYGVTIAMISRGSQLIPAPGRDELLFPGDILQVIGTDEQINRFKAVCEVSGALDHSIAKPDYVLRSLVVEQTSTYANKSIRECGLREATKGLVVGIEKRSGRMLNPDSNTMIEPGDVLWVVGNRSLIGSIPS